MRPARQCGAWSSPACRHASSSLQAAFVGEHIRFHESIQRGPSLQSVFAATQWYSPDWVARAFPFQPAPISWHGSAATIVELDSCDAATRQDDNDGGGIGSEKNSYHPDGVLRGCRL